jgi:hypothetical protein
MNEVVIYPKRLKLLGFAAGSLVFVLLGLYFFAAGMPLPLVVLTSYLGVPFFGLCFAYAVYRLLVPAPLLVISDEGLYDNASAVGAGMLRWEEIAELVPYEFAKQRFIGVVPVDVGAVIARQPPLKRMMAKMNRGMAGTPFNIPQNMLPMPIEELYLLILKRRRDAA